MKSIPRYISDTFNMSQIDLKYIYGRDNYTCNNCRKDLYNSGLNIKCINPQGELVSSNYVVFCNNCLENPPLSSPVNSFQGRLIVITGPMYSEKSTTTESEYNKNTVFNKNRVWVKPNTDDRLNNYTRTHNQREIPAMTIDSQRPDLALSKLIEYDVIVFDEVQFFSERILYVIHQLLERGALVIANGLKLTAARNRFGVMHYLLAEADDIILLKSVCNICWGVDSASRTKSFNLNTPSVSTGGTDKYYVSCCSCDGSIDEIEFLKKSFQEK